MSDIACSRAGCPVAVSGLCLEGFKPPTTCPYYASADVPAEEVASYTTQELIDLPSGEALTERQAADVTREDTAKVVIIAGPYNSGKTTMLTSLYEAFQDAPFANYLFRGSRTLVGFEKRAHLGRIEAGDVEAKTSHTSVGEGVVFLHLALASLDELGFEHASLLLSDISGELFRHVRDSTQAAKEISALQRADHLCIVIDGERIASEEGRQVARNDSRSILRSIMEANVLPSEAVIDIVFTKWDLVVQATEADVSGYLSKFIDGTKQALASLVSTHNVKFHEVAARPSKSAKTPFAHGLPTLLRSWMAKRSSMPSAPTVYVPHTIAREFARFAIAIPLRPETEGVYDVSRV